MQAAAGGSQSSTLRARWRRWWPRLRRWHQFVLVSYIVATIACISMVVGPYLNDRAIEQNPGRALATVTSVGVLRTMVDYQDAEGYYRVPEYGLLYPSDLREGQRVWVQYAQDNTDLVKVEGRRWTLAIIPALSVWASASILAILGWVIPDVWQLRRKNPPTAADTPSR